MKKIFQLLIVLISIVFAGCSKNDELVNPVSPPPYLFWIPSGLDSNMVLSLYRTSSGDFLAGTNYGLFVSADSGGQWNLNKNISSTVTCMTGFSNNTLLAGTSGGGMFISNDNGKNWSNIGLHGFVVTAIAVNRSGKLFAATRNNGIYSVDSLSGVWTSVNPAFNVSTFSSILITNDNTIFAGGTGVYRSDDNGINWVLKNKGLGNWSVQSLIADKAGFIDAGTDNGGFFRTNDNGENWTKLNNGLTNTEITTLALNSQGHIFAGTFRGGIFRSVDNGLNWTNADSGLTNKMVETIYCSNDILFAGTFSGLFKTLNQTTR